MTYDKFFKEAQKAAGLAQGGSSKKGSEKKPKFKLRDDQSHSARNESPEDRVRAELALRMKDKRAAHRRKINRVPVGSALFLVFCLCGGVVGYYRSAEVETWLSKIEIRIFGQASAADESAASGPSAKAPAGKEKSSPSSVTKKEKSAETKESPGPAEATNIHNWTPEELSFFSKLNDRKKELDLRESELSKLEEELQKRQAELDQKIRQLESMRSDISQTLKTRVAVDKEKVDKLVDFYSTMKPQTAAKVIETINEDLAVEVLDHMKKKNAAEILDMMNPKKARRLSELLTGYERSTASVEGEAGTPPSAETNKDQGQAGH